MAKIPSPWDDRGVLYPVFGARQLSAAERYTTAEEENAENMLVIKDAPELIKAYEATIRLHTGHAHPYQRQTVAGSSGVAPARVNGNEEVHGNKNSKIYHLPNCPGYADMNPASVVTFANEAEAEHAGYRKAKNCR